MNHKQLETISPSIPCGNKYKLLNLIKISTHFKKIIIITTNVVLVRNDISHPFSFYRSFNDLLKKCFVLKNVLLLINTSLRILPKM